MHPQIWKNHAEKLLKLNRNGTKTKWKFDTQIGDGKYQDSHEKLLFFDVSKQAKMHDDKNVKS